MILEFATLESDEFKVSNFDSNCMAGEDFKSSLTFTSLWSQAGLTLRILETGVKEEDSKGFS